MNPTITHFKINDRLNTVHVVDINNNRASFRSADFIEWFCDWANEQDHGIWNHYEKTGRITHAMDVFEWDDSRKETFSGGFNSQRYNYRNFFTAHINQLTDLFTRYAMSAEDITWESVELSEVA